MQQEKVHFYEEIGKVVYRKKTGVKRLVIRVKPSGEVYVTLPFLVSLQHAEEFLISKKDWVIHYRKKFNVIKQKKFVFIDNTEFHTYLHTLKIVRTENKNFRKRISIPYVEVFLPFTADIESDECQKFIKNSLVEAFRKEAISCLPERVWHYAKQYSFNYSGVSIKRMKSRWGSCSGKNKICLNLYLMALPEHLRDYVILHELVHTVEKNHGGKFWQRLESICPDARNFRKEIKNYSSAILY